MWAWLRSRLRHEKNTHFGVRDLLAHVGPGLLVTVGFIDPGNWASNLAAGADHGYVLLWMVTLSTLMLVVLQHNVAHLGIATGLCLSEAATLHLPRPLSRGLLGLGMAASVATSLAELLGGAIALHMLLGIPIPLGALLVLGFAVSMLLSSGYRRIERWIITFVSIIGLAFIYELSLVPLDWPLAARSWVTPSFPPGSMVVVMSVLGAVVMPHNLFLHSEIIQSRQWQLTDEATIRRQLRYEFLDTLFSMIVGWAINSAMILLAAATFFKAGVRVDALEQASRLLEPLLGSNAAVVFAVALLLSGLSSTMTSAMAAGSIFSGIFGEPFDIRDNHSRLGVLLSLGGGYLILLFVGDSYRGLVLSQMALSVVLPFVVFLQVYLTSSERVMGRYKNGLGSKVLLYGIAGVVTALNLGLLASVIG